MLNPNISTVGEGSVNAKKNIRTEMRSDRNPGTINNIDARIDENNDAVIIDGRDGLNETIGKRIAIKILTILPSLSLCI